MNSDCLFCKIIDGEIPSFKVYEDNEVLAFLDISPVNPGHTLVIPKAHSRTLLDMDNRSASLLLPIAKRIAQAQKEALSADGVSLSMNVEREAGQIIFHPHLHVIPRYADDGFNGWRQKKYENDDEPTMLAEKLSGSVE